MIARRTLLQAVSGLVAGMLAEARAFDMHAAAAATLKLETLTRDQARIVAAIAERIWPGAEAAGAATYIDRALMRAYRSEADFYRAALPQLDAAARHKFAVHFVDANGSQQDALLADLEAGRLSELPGARGAALFNLLRKRVQRAVDRRNGAGGGWSKVRV